jgi:hypothetical protein
MKTKFFIILVLSVLLSGSITKAQDGVYNFLIKDSEIAWQKVYSTNLKFDDIVNYFKESGLLRSFEISENKMIGDLKVLDCNPNEIGYEKMSNSTIDIQSNNFTGFFIIEFKEGKYRATIKRIQMIEEDTNDHLASIKNLEHFAFKADSPQFRKNFLLYLGQILDNKLNKMFEIKEIKEENW